MKNFAKNYDAALHHLRTVVSSTDDREAVRRLIVARKHIESCIDDINSATK